MTSNDKKRSQQNPSAKPIPAPSPEQQETTKESLQRPQEFHNDNTSPDPSIAESGGNARYGVNSSQKENLRN